MNLIQNVGTQTRVTASGVTCITVTARSAGLIGAMANNGAQGTVDIFHGTATGATTFIIASGITLLTGVFTPLPAYGSGGIAVLLTGFTTPNVTFYWKPME